MQEKQYTWHKIAEHINELSFGENFIAVTHFNGRKICVAKQGEEAFAFSFTCPHAGGIMAYGQINQEGQVVCPLHRYRFDMRTGRNVSGEGYYLMHWPLRITEEGVYLGTFNV